jgi:AcrR family transcriptional regulator
MAKLTKKGRERYVQIIEKSMFLFNDKGYVNTGMDEIASACSCDVANLYNYFTNKEHILFLVIKSMISAGVDTSAEILANKKLRPFEKLKAIIYQQMDNRVKLGFTDLYTKYKTNLDPDHAREIVALRDKYDQQLRDLILEGIAVGDFKKTDVKLAVITIGAFIERIVVWYSPKGKLSLSEVTDLFCSLLFDGIGVKETTPNLKRKAALKTPAATRIQLAKSALKGK